jgi:hypothetical protein
MAFKEGILAYEGVFLGRNFCCKVTLFIERKTQIGRPFRDIPEFLVLLSK